MFSRPKFSLFAISISSFRFLAPRSSFSVVSLESALARRFSKFGNLLIFSPPLSISKICKSCIKVAFSNKFSAASSPKISFTSVLWMGALVCWFWAVWVDKFTAFAISFRSFSLKFSPFFAAASSTIERNAPSSLPPFCELLLCFFTPPLMLASKDKISFWVVCIKTL